MHTAVLQWGRDSKRVAQNEGKREMSLRFKRHYKLVVLLVLASTVLITGVGDERIIAYSVPDSEPVMEQALSSIGLTAPEEPAIAGSQVLILDASYAVLEAGHKYMSLSRTAP